MKRITIKSALMRLVVVVLLTLGTISVSAQYYMNVVQKDGVKVQYLVSDIDSVYFSGQQSPAANYEYVDLGLSVKWATFNVGATKPEEYGDYYAWGETEPKTDYSWSTYKYCNGSSSTLTKYCNNSNYGNNGFTDTKTTLDPDDDVAHVKWGGDWRMPTKDEFTELLNNCTWTWATLNGVNGYRVTSNKSGYTDRSIFLPAAGYRLGPYLNYVGSNGGYWSSSLYTNYPNDAWYVDFGSDGHGTYDRYRYYGRSVRPVCPSEEWLNAVSITLNSNLDSIVTGNTITLSATVKHGDEIIDREVAWSSGNPSIASVSATGVVTGNAVGSTTITATCMGKTATCTITIIGPQIEYVDLGLSVKWATFNVGATKPEEYGDYYAWGETERKTDYSWSTYKYCNGSYSTMTKYCNDSIYGNNGFTDTKTTLDPDDDVAHVKWGGDWRMPTKDEFTELLNNCTWTWTTLNDVKGYRVTSNKSGYTDRSIFLPVAGYRFNAYLYFVGSYGNYWSGSLDTDSPRDAWSVRFDSDYRGTRNYDRYDGLSVRPVCPSEEWLNAVSITLNSNLDSIVMGNTITLSATVKHGDEIIDREVTWTSDNPSIASVSKTGVVTAIAVGSTTITAICMGKTATCTITVIEPHYENRYEYVDLGLSVKWATCNVGATKPDEYGDYYAWGETEPKTNYSWSTYKYCNGSYSTLTKYCNDSSYGNNGFTDTKTTLDPDDDVAHVKWGGDWRMPTKDEFTELLNNCTWTWITLNGVKGYRVTSKKSGYTDCSIFLPAAGCRLDTDLGDVGSSGQYWSSSLLTDRPSRPSRAWYVYFASGDHNPSQSNRYDGRSVRPVCP